MRKLQVFFLILLTAGMAISQTQAVKVQKPDPTSSVRRQMQYWVDVLSLTPEQTEQVVSLFVEARKSQDALRSEFQVSRQNLGAAIKNNDANAIEQASELFGSLSAKSTSARAKAAAAFYQVLTAEQQTKFNQIEKDRHGPMLFGGLGIPAFGPVP